MLKKTLESISFDRRRNLVEWSGFEEEVEDAMRRLSIAEAGPPESNIANEIIK